MSHQHHINYIEIPVNNMLASKKFFSQAFGWGFVDYGADYAAFTHAGIDGGFYQSQLKVSTDNGSVLLVLYSDTLEESQAKVLDCGGTINKAIFSFPGGRRFLFNCPSGNEFAIWSDK